VPGLNGLARELLRLKLRTAGWDGQGSLEDEMSSNRLHEALAISERRFRNWLLDAATSGGDSSSGLLRRTRRFKFRPGHLPKLTGAIEVSAPGERLTAQLRHNELQSALYQKLVKQYGEDNVGTEVGTGDGTAIDVVVKTKGSHRFYEIKIAGSVRSCIRQALGQLLEYVYWRGEVRTKDKMFVVGELPITADAEKYLRFIRRRFRLPVYYLRFTSPGPEIGTLTP
jgi:hypothetical protein